MNLYQRLLGHARFRPDKCAIKSEDGSLSYRQLQVCVDNCLQFFSEQGLQPGDRLAILALNHPDWFIALFAAARAGLILVPLNWRLSVAELEFVIEDSEPRLLLYDAALQDTAQQLHANWPSLQLTMVGSCDFPPATQHAAESLTVMAQDAGNLDSEVLIVYTSGTTGRPKGAVLTQRALLCSAGMSQHMYDLTAQDTVLNVLPLFHVGGLNIQPLPTLLYGGTLVSQARFDPEQALTAIQQEQVTLINTVPTILQALLASKAWPTADLSSLRAISIGSTDVPISLIQQVLQQGIPLLQVYGATEMAPIAIYQRIEDAERVGSIGRSGLLCDIRLVNQAGEVVATGESGEIQVKGDNLLSRYWNNPQATNTSLHEGWFGSGDVAHQDSEGYFWFDDRVKHVVISGGENIYPAELERVIRELPGVAEVSVVGKADARWGEVPVAVVVPCAALDAQAVIDSCARLARFKHPREVIFVAELPRNALGKVQVQAVKQVVADSAAGS